MDVTLTPSAEDYLKTIYEIAKEKKIVRVKDITERLKVKASSAISAVKMLANKELLIHEHYGYIELTTQGIAAGRELYERHLILYRFLNQVLQVDPGIAKKDACAIEHYLHPQTVERIVNLLDFISEAPNNEPQWMIKFKKFLDTGISECKYAKTLDRLEAGKSAVIKSINIKGELKKRLMDMGIMKGEKITVIKKAPLGDPIEFSIKGYSISLRKSEAKQIEIEEENDATING
jgi:DtxR family Mn-dependent transcriptional regulator